MSIIKPYNTLNNFDLPRNISTGLKFKIFFSYPFAIIGAIFFLFGFIFPIIFSSMTDFKSAFSFSDNDPVVSGVILNKKETNSSENKHRIYDYEFEYSVNCKTYTGNSFSTASDPKTGDTVIVQYNAKQNQLSRIQGMRTAPFDIWIVPFTCIFPLIGLIFVILSIKKAQKNIYLVQNGILITGKVIRKEPTNTKINKQTVYKVFFQYKAQDGNLQEAFIKTHITHNLGDEEKEPLVYDSQNPSSAVLLDSLPKKIRELLTT